MVSPLQAFYGTSGRNAWTIVLDALQHYPEWEAAFDSWQAPTLSDTRTPGWYRTALFNELYYLVDGGTAWENGEVGQQGSAAGRFAYLESYDYPFYSTLDVWFYSSWALLQNKPLNFDAWDIDAYYASKWREVDLLDQVIVVETGPERGVVEFQYRVGERTRIVQRMVVHARSPRIDFVTDIDWHERQTLLKVGFQTAIRNRRATYEIQFGTIDRPTHRNTSWEAAAFEVPAQRFVDLSDAYHGVALLCDCKHGYSVDADTLWLSLLKGAVNPDPDADRGPHRFTYSLLPHTAGLDDVRREAYILGRPLLWRRERAHPGRLPACFSLVDTASPGVVIETAKWAEDDDALIVRLYEAEGGATRTTLMFGMPVGSVDEVDLLERDPRPLDLSDNHSVRVELGAREIKTLRVRPG